jgi:hypothetical protein
MLLLLLLLLRLRRRSALTHVGADDEAAAFDCNGAEQRQPCVTAVGSRGEVEVHVLGIEGLAQQRHVVLPADGGGEVDADTADGGADGAESCRRALGPDEPLGASLRRSVSQGC